MQTSFVGDKQVSIEIKCTKDTIQVNGVLLLLVTYCGRPEGIHIREITNVHVTTNVCVIVRGGSKATVSVTNYL